MSSRFKLSFSLSLSQAMKGCELDLFRFLKFKLELKKKIFKIF